MENKRKCAICGKELDFLSSPEANDVCSEECNDIYCQIPPNYIYWDCPEVKFIGGIHRDYYRPESNLKVKRKAKVK